MGFKYSPELQQLATLLSSDPAAFYAVMADRERQLEAYLDLSEEPYTVVWSSSGTQPAVGATGFTFGAFTLQGRICDFWGLVATGGAGFAAGTGNYFVNPPIVPVKTWISSTGASVQRTVGSGAVFDNSASVSYGLRVFHIPSDGDLFGFGPITGAGAAGSRFAATVPFTFATADSITFCGRYTVDA